MSARVLIVEDDAVLAECTRRDLQRLGHIPAGIVLSSAAALAALAQERPDLVLVDIVLGPQDDGIALAEKIRRDFDLPVVFVTAYADEATLNRAKLTQPLGYVLKPIERRELQVMIEIALHNHAQQRRLRQVEQALRASEEQYHALYEDAADLMWTVDVETGRIVMCNETACRMLGFPKAEIIGKGVQDFCGAEPGTPRPVVGPGDPVTGVIENVEVPLRRKDGSVFSVLLRATPVRDAAGRITQHRATMRDITARKEVEAEVRRLFDFNRGVLDALAAPLCVLDEGGCILAVNEAWRRVGVANPPQPVNADVGANYLSACRGVTGDDAPMAQQMLVGIGAVARGELAEYEEVYPCHSPTRQRWYSARVTRFSEAGQVRVVIVHLDITCQMLTDQALRHSESRFHSVWEHSVDAMRLTDADGILLAVNDAYCRLVGADRKALEGRPFTISFREDPGDPYGRVLERYRGRFNRRAIPVRQERRVVLESGRVAVVDISSSFLELADGRTALLSLFRDVTEQQAAQARLRLQDAALVAADNAIVITDHAGRVEWVNPAFCRQSGYAEREAIGRNLREFIESDEHPAEYYRAMWETIIAGRVWRGEIVNRRKDGAAATEQMTITAVRDDQHTIRHFIAIKQDITEHKKLEEQLYQTQRLEALGTLASGVAHDLNNILSPILLTVEALKNRSADEEEQSLFAMLQESTTRGAEIIRQLLTFSRGTGGKRTVVPPRHLIREITRMIRETFPRDIEIQHSIADGLWSVVADAAQLHQVLLNLCVNARDAMPTGGHLTLEAGNVTLAEGDAVLPAAQKPGPYVMLAVGDSGHGIPPEIRARIFDPFFTTKPLGKGTGLGLSTVLGIVRSHEGFVTVDSEPNRGSLFRVYLPATMAEAPAAPPRPEMVPTGRSRLALVVDDERHVREATRLILEDHDFRVVTAVNGQDALRQFQRYRAEISVVLTDIMMPVMNGVALVRALRELDPAVRIVATSGMTEIEHEHRLAEMGVTEIVMKPCVARTLIEALQRQLESTPPAAG